MPSRFGLDEDVVPEAGFEVRLHLGQIEVGAGAAAEEFLGVVEERRGRSRRGSRTWVRRRPTMWRSSRCQPRGADEEDGGVVDEFVTLFGLGSSKVMVRRTASRRLSWPSSRLSQVGVVESSKSAMKTLAPELRALMIILRSTGPVISTRRSCRSAGRGATVHSEFADLAVSGRKSGRSPASSAAWRVTRAARSSLRRALCLRWRPARKARASGVRTRVVAVGGGGVDGGAGREGHGGSLMQLR